MKSLIAITLAFVSVASFIGCKEEARVQITNLYCEYLTNPKGIDATHPQLSWQLKSDQRGQRQIAYRLLVASSQEKLAKDEGDLWDSGKIKSDQSRHIEYNGKSLQSRTLCFWKVMVWPALSEAEGDKDGKPSAWSEPAFWSMGLLEKDDWTAQWIGSPDSITAPYYRHTFHLDDVPGRAPVYLASLGYFELFINGEKVGNEVLAPAVSNFSERTYYQTYDVAAYLKKGKNSIGIWMGTGWYSPGLPGVKHHSPVVRAQLEIPNLQPIVTDIAWETKTSARSLIGEWRWGKFGGELLDARLIDLQWWNTEHSTKDWNAAVIVETADVPCTAQKCRNNIQLDEIASVSIEQLDDTTVLVDFGTNLTGMFNMKFYNLDPDQKITIHYADLDGRDPEEAWRVRMGHKEFATYNQQDEFISAGNDEEQFNNVFNYHGYRYAIIEGLNYMPQKEDLAAIPVETEVPEVGSFTCSNDLYNRIHKMVRWTYRALNLGGQTVDCPHRERVGYGDGQTAMDVGCYNFDVSTLYTKWSQNWWDEQKEDGFVPFVAPTPHDTGGGPAWGAMSVVVPWKTYLFYNDIKLLETGYPYMKKYIEYLSSHSEDGVLQDIFPGEKWPNLGDWVPPRRGMDKSEWVDDNSRRFFNNCYRTYLLQIMMKVGKLLGKTDDVAAFEQELNIARKAVHEQWFNPEDTTYANGEQPYLIFPLQTGITPGELKDAVFKKYIHTMMVKDKGHLNTGMIGTQITFDYLLENNRNDLIDIMVNKKTYPGWGYMVEKGATTCWEQWNGFYSQIHSCFPYIGGWFYRGLGGIQWDTENPGFKNIILRPALVESIDWVNCNYKSSYGEIVSHWKIEDNQFHWKVTVPVNSTATVYIQGNNITEGGSSIEDAVGVTFIKHEDGTGVYEVESGNYSFESSLH
ncbi:MAG: family 78 glycoside hydrolase catalytic domain [Bacteroidetes bacterium]|nr:family 78 glycoside hydrolase catalytic domain [Bacteroidota bacterium]